MGIGEIKPLSDQEIEQHLRKHGIPLSAKEFVAQYSLSDHVVRNRNHLSAILVAYDREILSVESITLLFQEKRLPLTVQEFLTGCAGQGIPECDATQRGFVTRFLKHYNPNKRLEDQSTIQKKRAKEK